MAFTQEQSNRVKSLETDSRIIANLVHGRDICTIQKILRGQVVATEKQKFTCTLHCAQMSIPDD